MPRVCLNLIPHFYKGSVLRNGSPLLESLCNYRLRLPPLRSHNWDFYALLFFSATLPFLLTVCCRPSLTPSMLLSHPILLSVLLCPSLSSPPILSPVRRPVAIMSLSECCAGAGQLLPGQFICSSVYLCLPGFSVLSVI